MRAPLYTVLAARMMHDGTYYISDCIHVREARGKDTEFSLGNLSRGWYTIVISKDAEQTGLTTVYWSDGKDKHHDFRISKNQLRVVDEDGSAHGYNWPWPSVALTRS